MNNRQMLYLLFGLTVLGFGLRFWAASWHDGWTSSVGEHQRRYQDIYAMCNDLAFRREKAPKGSDEASFRAHFQAQAFEARIGIINVAVRETTRGNQRDKTFTIGFEDPQASFQRQQLSVFLFNSELRYPRLRTTQLTLAPVPTDPRSKSVDSGAERQDLWRVSKLEFKQRSPTGEAAKP